MRRRYIERGEGEGEILQWELLLPPPPPPISPLPTPPQPVTLHSTPLPYSFYCHHHHQHHHHYQHHHSQSHYAPPPSGIPFTATTTTTNITNNTTTNTTTASHTTLHPPPVFLLLGLMGNPLTLRINPKHHHSQSHYAPPPSRIPCPRAHSDGWRMLKDVKKRTPTLAFTRYSFTKIRLCTKQSCFHSTPHLHSAN